MNRSEDITEFATALSKAQGEFDAVVKGKKADLGRGGSYSYADLAAVCGSIMPVLSRHGIAVVQGSDGEHMKTLLAHTSGQWIETNTPIFQGRNGGAQGYGSGATYARRYGLLAAVGVAPEDDDDGAKASGPDAERANHATDGLDQAWIDSIKDGLDPDHTRRELCEAIAQQIMDDLNGKAPRAARSYVEKKKKYIDQIQKEHDDLFQGIQETFDTTQEKEAA